MARIRLRGRRSGWAQCAGAARGIEPDTIRPAETQRHYLPHHQRKGSELCGEQPELAPQKQSDTRRGQGVAGGIGGGLMRKTSLDMVYELARQDKRIIFIGSDLGIGTLKQFKAEMPDRFLMEGVSEANIVGIAAGLALEGKIVYINTIATFLTRRCFEQVALDLCLHNANVRLIASGGGLVYAPLGPTHEAIDDLAIFRALPRMTIVAPADADEMRRLMPLTVDHSGPIYIRLGKGGDPIVTNDRRPFQIGKTIPMRDGSDALIVTTGVMLKPALDAADALRKDGIEAAVLHVPTVKPFDSGT